MSTPNIFSDPSINLHISPFSIYVLLGREDNLKNREILKKIEKRKTLTGNIFSIRAARKDLVVGGESRKVLKDVLGNSNIIAEVMNPGSSIPEYLHARIDYDSDNIDNTANQIRHFIKELCEKDISRLRGYYADNSSPKEKNFLKQFSLLYNYLDEGINKKKRKTVTDISKKENLKKRLSRNIFQNDLTEFSQLPPILRLNSNLVKEPYEDYSNKPEPKEISYYNEKELKRAILDLGGDDKYVKLLLDQLEKIKSESIYNIRNIKLRFSSKKNNEKCPKLELVIVGSDNIPITIGTKVGCMFYGSILFSMYEGHPFKRTDLTDVIAKVKKKYNEKGSIFFTKEDYDTIPNLYKFSKIYEAIFGKNNGTFLTWCLDSFDNRKLDTAASHIKRNIEQTLRNKNILDLKKYLLINKKAQIKDNIKSPKQLYWIDFPIDQVEFPDDKWGDLKNDFSKTKTNSSPKYSYIE